MIRFQVTGKISNLQASADALQTYVASWLDRIEAIGRLYLTFQVGNVKIVFFIGRIKIFYGPMKFFKISIGYNFCEM